jgi:hypothetical protein
MGKNSRSGSGIRIRDEHFYHIFFYQSLETFLGLKILKFFDADPGIFLTRDPGWKKFGSGISISDPQH